MPSELEAAIERIEARVMTIYSGFVRDVDGDPDLRLVLAAARQSVPVAAEEVTELVLWNALVSFDDECRARRGHYPNEGDRARFLLSRFTIARKTES